MHCLWDATIAGSKEVQCVNSDVNVVRLHKEGKSTQWPVITWISAHDLKMCHGKGIGYRRGAQGVVGDPQHLLGEGDNSVQNQQDLMKSRWAHQQGNAKAHATTISPRHFQGLVRPGHPQPDLGANPRPFQT